MMDSDQQLTAAAAKAAAYDLRLVLDWEHETMGAVSAGVLRNVINWLDSASVPQPGGQGSPAVEEVQDEPEPLPAQD